MTGFARPADELYRHRPETPESASGWAERSYHLLAFDDLILNAGRALWVGAGERTAFAGLATPTELHVVRAAAKAATADADDPDTGPVRIEVLEPLRRLRLAADDPDSRFGFDLEFEARSPGVVATPNRIVQAGAAVTDYTNFFQSGLYSGWVRLAGREHSVERRAGFRDRGWGLRKHEGAPRRGLAMFCACELPGGPLHLGLFESAEGERMRTFGWFAGDEGRLEEVVGIEHDLRIEAGLLQGGVLSISSADGREHRLELEIRSRLFLKSVGYSRDPEDRLPGSASYDLGDPATIASLRGQVDNSCRFTLDGEVEAHGFVETGIGAHHRYGPGAGEG